MGPSAHVAEASHPKSEGLSSSDGAERGVYTEPHLVTHPKADSGAIIPYRGMPTVWSLRKFTSDFDHIESQITFKVGTGATLHHCPQTLGRDYSQEQGLDIDSNRLPSRGLYARHGLLSRVAVQKWRSAGGQGQHF